MGRKKQKKNKEKRKGKKKERKFTGFTVSMEVRRTQSHSMSSSQSRMHSQSLKFQSEKNHSFLYICEIQCWGKNRSHSELCSLHSAARHRALNRARVRWNLEPKPYPARKARLGAFLLPVTAHWLRLGTPGKNPHSDSACS